MESSLHIPDEAKGRCAKHLCVLVHGLWGNVSHLNYLTQSLLDKYGEDQLAVLVCKRNASWFTYDGIEIGAERVMHEIEETLNQLEDDGYQITRFSIIGYSLGGLIARYVIGLMYAKGLFEHRLTPVNFTTFATPWLGARSCIVGWRGQIWNVLGARIVSESGRQLFMIDKFRETGRPLVSVLADPNSIFIHALKLFENRCLYANIVNDRTVLYYTAGLDPRDPYSLGLDKLKLNYVKGYEKVVLDPDTPYEFIRDQPILTPYQYFTKTGNTWLRNSPIILGLSLLLPIALVVFLVNSGVQTIRSNRRIMLHEQDTAPGGPRSYRASWLVHDMRAGIQNVFEQTNAAQGQDRLSEDEEAFEESQPQSSCESEPSKTAIQQILRRRRSSAATTSSITHVPRLALTDEQFECIRSLDAVGIRKYPVHIHGSSHSHAAIIVRSPRKAFDDGKIVVKHWLEQIFVL